jgi:hypothetical protein
VVAVEVKTSMSANPDDFFGLSVFAEFAGARFLRGVLFYSGDKIPSFRVNGNVFHALPISSLCSL